MKNSQRSYVIPLLMAIIIILIIEGGIYIYNNQKSGTVSTISSETQPTNVPAQNINTIPKITGNTTISPIKTPVAATNGKCGLHVINPSPNASIIFPLTLEGIIDNTNSKSTGCSWQMFEGQAGTAQIYYNFQNAGWKPIGKSAIISVANWTANKTTFSSVINFVNDYVGIPSGTPMKITLTAENPSGKPELENTFDLPIYLK